MKIIILVPIYNDWQSASKLLEEINSNIVDLDCQFSVIIVNDASSEQHSINAQNLGNLQSVKIINMKENKGHARCIASGLKYIYEKEEFDYVIPMDGDGEDRPEEIKNFVEYLNYASDKPIVGERVKRSESLLFKFCYNVHKILTFAFTGQSIKFGNYTCLSKSTVEKMINDKATWSSFSGTLTKIEKDRSTVPSIRGSRYFGPSKMSFKNLIVHSLAIISVFKINVLIRSVMFLLVYIFLIHQNISAIMLIPIPLIILLIIMVFYISKRESLDEINNSQINISNIDSIK
ncbi:MAG: glycosyltransferase family 2 protein [Candidatus Pelagibacter sp.]